MKAALVILDGMADRSQASLEGLTPLQAASTPNLDTLARTGACGHMYALEPGECPASDQAHWRILGYGDYKYPGRAGIEAAGAGSNLEDGDVVVAANLATTVVESERRYVQAAPAHLPFEQAERIFQALSGYEGKYFDVELLYLGGPFMLVVLKGGASAEVTDSDPLFYRLPVRRIEPLEGVGDAAVKTSIELSMFTDWVSGVLDSHPVNEERKSEGMTVANYVLLKWASVAPRVPPFSMTWGFNALAVASGGFYAGLAKVLGMDLVQIEPGEPGVELRRKLESALEALKGGHDFAFVHTKAADEASHTGRPSRKVRALEEIDGAMETVIESLLPDPDILLVVTTDHATPSSGSDWVIHSGESVPLVMSGVNARVDKVEAFDEISCASGSLGTLRAENVMPMILNLTDRARFGTSRLFPRDLPYRPLE